ncbi:MAG: M20/M25/M40 family metallo-hydrolase [Clostridia bacterium]|nr:M20/M25/M40 family metallo-hydrolase [Clostridia bacterium]
MRNTKDFEKVIASIDRNLIIDLAKEFIETPSPTGEEQEMAKALYRAYKEVGLEAKFQYLYDDRANVVGTLRGKKIGPVILYSGHMDTSIRGDEDWLEGKGFKNVATIVDNKWIYGNGIYNMKCGHVCYIAMIDALRRAGVELNGDIILAGVVGEIEKAPVDEYHGREYDAYGVGTRFLLQHGVAADFHILGEPTGMTPRIGQVGSVWAKVTTRGGFSHTAFSNRNVHAIEEMWKIWNGLEEWIADYKKRNVFMEVTPQINRAAIRGGLPWRGARTPNDCSMYIDIRIAPDQYPVDIQREFREVVNKLAEDLKYPVDVDFYVSRPGTNISPNHFGVQTLVDSHKVVTGEEVVPKFAPPTCTDAIDANRYGVPTVAYGAGGRPREMGSGLMERDIRTKEGEFVYIDDMVTTAQVYSVAAIKLTDMDVAEIKKLRDPMPGFSL